MRYITYFFLAFLLFISCTPDEVSENQIFNTSKLLNQKFTIDPSKDTLLYGKDGTELHITKNTFAGKDKIPLITRKG